MESKSYWKAITYAPRAPTTTPSSPTSSCTDGGREAARPRGAAPRAVDPRALRGAQRLHNHLIFLGTRLDRPGRHRPALLLLPRARPGARPVRARHRRAHARPLRRRSAAWPRTCPPGFERRGAHVPRVHARRASTSTRSIIGAQPIFRDRTVGIGVITPGVRPADGPDRAERPRLGRGLGPARARCRTAPTASWTWSPCCARTATRTTAT